MPRPSQKYFCVETDPGTAFIESTGMEMLKRGTNYKASGMQRNELLIWAEERAVRRFYEGDICPEL